MLWGTRQGSDFCNFGLSGNLKTLVDIFVGPFRSSQPQGLGPPSPSGEDGSTQPLADDTSTSMHGRNSRCPQHASIRVNISPAASLESSSSFAASNEKIKNCELMHTSVLGTTDRGRRLYDSPPFLSGSPSLCAMMMNCTFTFDAQESHGRGTRWSQLSTSSRPSVFLDSVHHLDIKEISACRRLTRSHRSSRPDHRTVSLILTQLHGYLIWIGLSCFRDREQKNVTGERAGLFLSPRAQQDRCSGMLIGLFLDHSGFIKGYGTWSPVADSEPGRAKLIVTSRTFNNNSPTLRGGGDLLLRSRAAIVARNHLPWTMKRRRQVLSSGIMLAQYLVFPDSFSRVRFSFGG